MYLKRSVKEKRHNQIGCENKRNDVVLLESSFRLAAINSKYLELQNYNVLCVTECI